MRRRAVIAGLAGAAAWPVLARAQPSSVPLVAFLSTRSAVDPIAVNAAFQRGRADAGYTDGKNVRLSYSSPLSKSQPIGCASPSRFSSLKNALFASQG